MELDLDRLRAEARRLPHRRIFVTVSGAHLYGFPSPDSDFDLRGVHVLPQEDLLGLGDPQETEEISCDSEGLELDLVSHDARKFVLLMLKKNGYVLEQLLSPIVVETSPAHEELKNLARDVITRHHAHHYLGFAQNQWKLFEKQESAGAKPLLYVFRVLLTGIHLMQSGEVEANLSLLNERFKLAYLDDLIRAKCEGPEKVRLDRLDLDFYRSEFDRLLAALEEARDSSSLPEAPVGFDALNDWVIRVRSG